MAINKVDFATGGAPTSLDDYVAILANQAGALTGRGKIPITNFGTTSTPQIAQSVFFVAGGVLYQADADTSISGTMANERYIEMVPSGSPTGATLTPTWTATAPTWSTAYDQYSSLAGNLVLGVMRDSDGYNNFVEVQDFLNVSDAATSIDDTLLGQLATLLLNHDMLVQYGQASLVESATSVAQLTNTYGGICQIDEANKYYAVFTAGDDGLQTYKWTGYSFTTVGNKATIAGSPGLICYLCRLSDTTIAFMDITNNELEKYSWDGTDWTKTGNSYDTTSEDIGPITPLDGSTIAMTGSDDITTFSFDGSDWSVEGNVGTALLSGSSINFCLAIDSGTIIVADKQAAYEFDIIMFSWDGTDWSTYGTGLEEYAGAVKSMKWLTDNYFAVLAEGTTSGTDCRLNVLELDGSVIKYNSIGRTDLNTRASDMASFDDYHVVVTDGITSNDIGTYEFVTNNTNIEIRK